MKTRLFIIGGIGLLLAIGVYIWISSPPALQNYTHESDRKLLGRMLYTEIPALSMEEVPVERAIARHLELLAAEWHAPKPIPYRIDRRKRQAQQTVLFGPSSEPSEIVTFSYSRRPFIDGLRECIALADWSFTVRDGVIIFTNTPDLYSDKIWQQPILPPK